VPTSLREDAELKMAAATDDASQTDITASDTFDGRTARSDRTHNAVVDAFLHLLDEGNLRPTTEQIAARAAVSPRSVYQIPHLRALESEAIHVIREVAGELERGVLLFSGGKDSAVVLHLVRKAFWPAALPFPVMHVDTGHNFPEVIEYRDRMVARIGARLIVASVQESIDSGRVVEENGPRSSRNRLQSVTLLDAIDKHGFKAAFGGARRDEERARAKERILSFRDDFGQWDPKRQRPELWSLYNGFVKPGEHVRVFPLSNWTELDVWQYVREEGIELPSIYFAHRREVFRRDGMLYATSEFVDLLDGEKPFMESVRFRTVGDMSCTGAVRSTAATLEEVVAEIAATRITERGETRADDRISEAAMEDRKKEGYF
jgi:sulfate adenylyltransferase subunit 2